MSNVIKEGCNFQFPWRFRHWRFKFRLIPSLITLLLLTLFVYLGCWQLGRASKKEALALKLKKGAGEIKSLEALLDEPEIQRRYQVIQLKGHFINSIQILLDNQIQATKPGYRILSIFHPEDNDIFLLVDRGWIPLGENRRILPDIKSVEIPENSIQILGRVDSPSSGLKLGSSELEHFGNFLRLQSIDFNMLSSFLKKPLYPFILRLEGGSPYAFETSELMIAMPASKHLGYALQWFTMAGATLIYFGILTLQRKKNDRKT